MPPLLIVFAPQSQGALSEISLFEAERMASVAIVSGERSGSAMQFVHPHAATAIVCQIGPCQSLLAARLVTARLRQTRQGASVIAQGQAAVVQRIVRASAVLSRRP
jgi:hypothetical protein